MTHPTGGVIGKVHVKLGRVVKKALEKNLMRTVLLIKMEKDRTTALGKIVEIKLRKYEKRDASV